MAAELLTDASRALDGNASPYPGAKWYFYASGTLTPQSVYANADLSTSLGAVVTADAGGKFVPIYFDATLQYRGILKNADGSVTVYDIDPINSSILDSLNAGMIGTDGGGTVQDVVDRLNTGSVDLRAFGGIPDVPGTTTHRTVNSTALTNAIAAGATTIQLFSNSDTETEWSFGSAWPVNDLAGIAFDVDAQCTIDHATSAIFSLAGAQIRYIRPTLHSFRDVPCTYVSRPDSNPANKQKTIFIEESEPDSSVLNPIQCDNTNVLKQLEIDWNTSDSWTSDAFSSTTDDSFTIAPGATDGKYHSGQTKLQPGDRLYANPGIASGTPLISAFVRHTGGYCGVSGETNGAPSLTIVDKATGVNGTSVVAPFASFPMATHSSYWPANSEWSIHVESYNTFSILFNGMVVYRRTVTGFIYDGGFGMYPLASGDSVIWRSVVKTSGESRGAGRLIKGVMIGDSRSMERDGAAVSTVRQALDQTYGVRCYQIDDIAVGGHSSADQLAVLEGIGAGLGVYNFAHVNIGTNDAQGAVAIATFMTNVQDIYDVLNDNGVALITFSIFGLWYTQGQAGAGNGQASVNYEKGGPYRAFLRRFCAEKGLRYVDEQKTAGPVLAHLVNPALSPNLSGTVTPPVYDNIHWSAILGEIFGKAIARAVLGNLFSRPTLALPMQDPGGAYSSGASASGDPIRIQISEGGMVSLAGYITLTPATDDEVIYTLPETFWPKKEIRVARPFCSDLSDNAWLMLNTQGQIKGYGFTNSTYVFVNQLSGYCIEDREVL